MKAKILIFGLSLFCILISSQSIKYIYYIEFANSNNKPVISKINKTAKIISYDNQQYEVIQYEEAFSNFKTESLRNTSLIEFKTLSDFNNFLFYNRNNIVKYDKIEAIDNPLLLETADKRPKIKDKRIMVSKKLLYTPNDYYLQIEDEAHTHLDLVNAKEAWQYSKGDDIIIGVSDNGFRFSWKNIDNPRTNSCNLYLLSRS